MDDLNWFSWTNVLFSIFMTVAIYSLPIVVWRYAIIRKPIDRKKAKWITVLYGVVAFIVMAILLFFSNGGTPGGAILLWSYVNYRVLISGDNAEEDLAERQAPIMEDGKVTTEIRTKDPDTAVAEVDEEQPKNEIRYCHKCGGTLITDSIFCSYCGTQLGQPNHAVRPMTGKQAVQRSDSEWKQHGSAKKRTGKWLRVMFIILLVSCLIISLSVNVVQYGRSQQDKKMLLSKDTEIAALNERIENQSKELEDFELEMLIQSKVVEKMQDMIGDLEEDIKVSNSLLEGYREKYGSLYSIR